MLDGLRGEQSIAELCYGALNLTISEVGNTASVVQHRGSRNVRYQARAGTNGELRILDLLAVLQNVSVQGAGDTPTSAAHGITASKERWRADCRLPLPNMPYS
ncbi:MAG: hypothetical protein HC869_01875 [Rhodospirillales bacterium]|nr:hypothetical protein [Rhodospirillales bacterium]